MMIALVIGLNGCFSKGEAKPSPGDSATGYKWPQPPVKNNPTESLIFETNFSEDMTEPCLSD